MASLFHPLCGSNPDVLLKLLLNNGPIARDRWPQVALALAVSMARWPFSAAEQMFVERLQPPDMPAPIFIVGYWRSGTTHLHNLMACSPSFGYITPLATGLPWDILGIVRALEPLLEKALPRDRYVDNVAVTPTSPQEDSIPLATMGADSYYHGLYFPHQFESHFRRDVFGESDEAATDRWRQLHCHLLKKVSIHQRQKPLLIKNPVYTGYIRHLREIWPAAKFIHIYRNPYRVFVSAQHYFNRLLPELALQSYGELPIEKLILESYPFLLQQLFTDTADLPADQFAELRFEDLQANPLQSLEALFQQLQLPDFEVALPHLKSYLADLQDYRQNEYALNAEVIAKVEAHWHPYSQRWGYGGDN
jgi:omega-hydroxy-beta-dihydromenaquinone-9 sulfotransferase